MRLINADKLIEICRKGWKLFGGEEEKLKHWVDEDDIRNQPTVEAIPIEWIEKQLKTVCDGCIEVETFGKWLIKNWRRENGIG